MLFHRVVAPTTPSSSRLGKQHTDTPLSADWQVLVLSLWAYVKIVVWSESSALGDRAAKKTTTILARLHRCGMSNDERKSNPRPAAEAQTVRPQSCCRSE